ncbi:MAG TPA: glycine cleavage system protein GcvH [Ginsengibacter sp.]|mgnify:CR=1 FL=1|nr:glycine cleavage system protein GcvH [Chitinophagaceae bacterium]HRN71511.1 glycine cleavage system protein GcvH [Ginsengibacter sp.]HRP16695.1 glycine cleavage system protein GcvH [Ginsengibacter sp.]HRP43351.1 glycine cleavage system protein GcvH [Ginsengibacter sp.]
MASPQNLKYTKDHEWISLDGDIATVGITDFAQQELGDVVYVEADAVGKELSAGDTFGSIDSVKTVSNLFLPVAGTITELNAALENDPALINTDPYGEGWIVKMKVSNVADISGLMDAAAYDEMISA